MKCIHFSSRLIAECVFEHIIIIINALFCDGDHVTYKGDFQRAINEAIYIYTIHMVKR